MIKKVKKKKIALTIKTEAVITAKGPKDYMYMFFGPPGTGKTTFADNMGTTFFISTDRGTRFLKCIAEEVNCWEDFEDELIKLEKWKDKNGPLPYDYFCIDHIDDLADMGQQYVCNKLVIESLTDAGHGRGWDLYKRLLRTAINRIKRLELGVIFICHEDMKKIKIHGIETDRIMPMMQKSAWKIIVPLVDIVGYISLHSFKQKGKRVELVGMQTRASKNIYCKDRTNRILPDGQEVEILNKHNADKFLDTFTKGETSGKENKKEKVRKHKKVKKKVKKIR